jgi:2TM domain
MTELITPTRNGASATAGDDASLRREAIRRLKKKRDFRAHLLAYVLVNGFLWLVWGVVYAAASGPWFPWPLFPLFGWGIGLVFHAWDVYGRKPFSEQALERELQLLLGQERRSGFFRRTNARFGRSVEGHRG